MDDEWEAKRLRGVIALRKIAEQFMLQGRAADAALLEEVASMFDKGDLMKRITPDDIARAIPIPGVLCVVDRVPECNWCDKPGPYDFATIFGPWTNGCEAHWLSYRASPELGVGKGQFWMVKP